MLCRGKEVPLQGVAVFCAPMNTLILLISLSMVPAVFAAAPATEDLPAIEKGLSDSDFKNRRQALKKVEGLKSPRKLELLKKSLSDSDPEMRERSARLLGKSRDKAAYKVLADSLAAASVRDRLPLMGALGDLGDKRAVKPLAALLADPDRDTRLKAAEVLGRLKSDDAVTPLLSAASGDNDEFVRKASVESLGKTGTQRSAAALRTLQAGADKKTAAWAANVLKAAGGK